MAEPTREDEPAKMRAFFRLDVRVPCRLILPDGKTLSGHTVDISAGGLRCDFRRRGARLVGEHVEVLLLAPGRLPEAPIPALVVERSRLVRLRFDLPDAARDALLAALLRIQGGRLL